MKNVLADLNKRMTVSSIAVVIIGFLIAFSSQLWVSCLLVLTIAAITATGIWEYAHLVRAKGSNPATSLMVVMGIAFVIGFFLSLKWVHWPQLPLILVVLAAVLFFLSHFKDPTDAIFHVAVEFFGLCYVAVPLSFLLGILYPSSHHLIAQDGRWWLVYLIVVTKITDVGAYFVGRLWGKTRLAPVLSPKKTVEGAIAGFLCAVVISVVLGFLGQKYSQGSFYLTLWEALILGMLIGVVGQIGDLAESLLKRDAVVKDSNTLPGVGGILDMVDSLLLTTPIVYFFISAH